METAVLRRTPTIFNLRSDLVETLNREAKSNHLPLDVFVENILMDISFDQPNKETIEAIEEARAGKYAGELDVSSFDSFVKSIEAIE